MSKQTDCWGIEVGANAIKAVRLVRTGNDLKVAEYDIVPFKKVLTTPDLDADEAIRVNLDQFLSRHNVSKSTVMVSVPGHSAFARFAKLPPVDPKTIPDIVRFEAVQQIPFPIDQVEWDYQVFAQEDSPDVEVGIFAITKDRVMQFLANYRSAGMHIDGITLSPLAVYNAFAYDMELKPDSPGVILMDIGTASTDVIIVENSQIWLRTLPIGGNNFTEALVRAFKLSFPKAEKLKREAATSKYARQIFQAMRPVFADLVQEMQRSLGFYQSINRDAKLTRLIGVGSTFRLPGMQKFLKQQLQMEVERPSGFRRLKVEGKEEAGFSENAMNLATAYGLALQGVELEVVHANLLPRHIIRQRLWKAKQPWIAAAAALMLAAVGSAAGKFWMEEAKYNLAYEHTATRVDTIVGAANRFVIDWRRLETTSDPRQAIDNLRRTLDYRDIWPKILLDLDLAALSLKPQPELIAYPPDYDALAPWFDNAQKRRQQNRIYIDSLTVDYKLIPEDPNAVRATAAAAPTDAMTIDEVFGMGRRKPAAHSAQQQQAAPGSHSPPSFLVTLKGSTPNADGRKLLGETYISWYSDQKNAIRADRPYNIVVPNHPFESLTEIEDTHKPTETSRTDNRRNPKEKETFVAAIPLPPPGRSELPGDIKFETILTFQLVRPEDARDSETQDRNQPRKTLRSAPLSSDAPPPPPPSGND